MISISSSAFTSWYFPSVMRIKVGMLHRKSKRVWTLIAPLERLPLAQLQSVRLREMVVESRTKISLSISKCGTGVFAYKGWTRLIRYAPKSANMRQSRLSLSRDSVDWLTLCLIPRWNKLFLWAFRQRQISLKPFRAVSCPKKKLSELIPTIQSSWPVIAVVTLYTFAKLIAVYKW